MLDKKLNRLILALLVCGVLGTLCVNGAVEAAYVRYERQAAETSAASRAEGSRAAQTAGDLAGQGETDLSAAGTEEETAEENEGPGASYTPSSGGKYAEFQKKFSDTENTLERMRANSSANRSEAEKRSEASSELRYWETQMNSLYQTLMEILPDEKAAVLSRDQQDWQKEREEKAASAAQNSSDQSGGTEYTLSQAESTRARAYELLEEYRSELSSIQ